MLSIFKILSLIIFSIMYIVIRIGLILCHGWHSERSLWSQIEFQNIIQKPDAHNQHIASCGRSYPFPSSHSVAVACWLVDWLLRLEKGLPAAAHALRIKRERLFWCK